MEKRIDSEKKSFIVSRDDKLFHIGLHQLSKGITIANSNQIYYLVGVLDAFTRAVWVEILDNKISLDVMFAVLKSLNILRIGYGLEVKTIITDNGSESGGGPLTKSKNEHPFER